MKIVTHSGNFHTDDIFGVAVLLFVYPNSEVIRTRDEQIIASADIVIDVGGVYDSAKLRFDHHQIGGALNRENTVPYASFGLVWKEYGEKVSGSKEIAEMIEKDLVLAVDAIDNGISVSVPVFDGVSEYTIGDFFGSFKTNTDTEEQLYKIFMDSISTAQGILAREITKARVKIEDKKVVEEIYAQTADKRIIDLTMHDIRFGSYGSVLLAHPEPIYVVHPHGEKFAVRALPLDMNTFENKKAFPEAWRSKTGAEFEEASGVKGAYFAHKSGYLIVANSKEVAFELANKSLNA
mgnify:CR=1 FL=1